MVCVKVNSGFLCVIMWPILYNRIKQDRNGMGMWMRKQGGNDWVSASPQEIVLRYLPGICLPVMQVKPRRDLHQENLVLVLHIIFDTITPIKATNHTCMPKVSVTYADNHKSTCLFMGILL